jgi:hypothetical protein
MRFNNNVGIKQHQLQHHNLLGLYGHIPGEFPANLSGWYPESRQVLLLKYDQTIGKLIDLVQFNSNFACL